MSIASELSSAILTIWAYLVIAVITILAFPVLLVLFIVLYPFDKKRNVVGRLFRLISVASTKLNPLWSFRVVGKIPPPPTRTICGITPFSFYSECYRWGMALAGDISLNRGNRDSAKNAMKACKEWLELGANVMIFPEGTRYSIIHSKRLNRDRSRDGKLGEFKEGAFRLAIETKADILPLAVAGTNHSIPVHSWKMAKSKGLVMVGTPISTKNMTLDDVETLKQKARAQVESMYKKLEPML